MSESSSAIFCGHRPLGYVANHIPLVTRYVTRRQEHLIVTATGRTFHTWGSNKLGLLSVSKTHPSDITALTADSYLVFAASDQDIYAWRRGDELQRIYRGHRARVHLLMPFGPHLISVDTESTLKVWNIKDGSEYLEMTFNNDKSRVTALCHPSTYMNKVLVGTRQGHIQLWNLQSTKLIYTFTGWNSGVECMEQAPAQHVVAVGLQSGDVIVHNLKYDETVVKFSQDWGPVTGITFRTDGQPVMLTGSPAGHLAVWDLEQRKLSSQMRNCHQGTIAGLKCLQGEPILVTCSPDNTVKQWIFDMTDGGGRLLRHREGHAAPPTRIRYYGASGENILSAGQDSSLRVFSTVADLLNRSLGHASFNRKLSKKHRVTEDPVRMPPILDFTTEITRDKEWDNIACVHRQQGLSTTWSFGLSKMGELQLLHQRFKTDPDLKSATATCLTLSICGNFVLIGYTSGHVDRFNIQSGLHRGTYQHGSNPAHRNPVRGVATDGLNRQTITGDSKGVVKFWRFKSVSGSSQLLGKCMLGHDLASLRLHRESGLLALAMEDFTIQVIDIDTRKIVRKFPGHSALVTDMTFSPDSRWLVTVSLDTTGRVWDLPTGTCVDYIKFLSPATSADFSPAGDVMSTSHVGDLAIYMWTNKTLYQHVTLKPVNKNQQPSLLALPSDLVSDITIGDEEIKMEVEVPEEEFVSPEQISYDLITLANLPGSRWLNLLNLDAIKAKNKPKAAPKKPKAAPFFLPTIPGLETKFDLSKAATDDNSESKSLNLGITNLTEFGSALGQSVSEEDYLAMISVLLDKGPSALDLEVRSLSPEGGGTLGLMEQFLTMLCKGLKTQNNWEVLEAWLGLYLRVHGDLVTGEERLIDLLTEVDKIRDQKWTGLRSELDTCLCMVTFFKSSLL